MALKLNLRVIAPVHQFLAAGFLFLGIVSIAAANQPDFTVYDEILVQNVRNGFVNYDGFIADDRFGSFIAQLGNATPEALTNNNDKLAFYINAYNALSIQGIINGNSPSSWWGRSRFFKRQKFRLLEEEINLHDLEHERIIPIGDPRIHFSIVCASLSCPRLSSHAYDSATVNLQLHDAARHFINDPTRNRFDLERRIAFLSRIFDWYAEDFESAAGSVQKYLARFIDDGQVQDALRQEEFEIRYLDYDWSLNGHLSDVDR